MSLVTIGSICSFFKGASIPRARMSESGDYLYLHYGDLYKGHETYINVNNPQSDIPFISDVEKLKKEQFVEDGDIIYILTSETIEDLGKALMVINPDKKEVVSGTETTIMKVIDKQAVEPRWLNYLLQTNRFKQLLRQYVTGMKVFRVHPRDISRIVIELPPIDIQRNIVEILDSINSLIQLNLKLNDYLTVLLDALWLQACEESEERLLSEVATTLSGGTPKTSVSEYWEGGTIPFFSPKDIGSPYTLETEKYVTELGVENCNSALCPVNTVFLTARGTVGKVGLAGVPMAMNQSCFAFSGVGIDQSSVYQVIKSAVCSLKAKANGATFAAINTRDLKVETVDVPVQSRLESFQNDARGILAMMLANAKENQCLAELRDALLPKLMSGEIDVSRADLTQLNNHLVDYAMSDCVSFHFSTYR